jgi:hypothetical protein
VFFWVGFGPLNFSNRVGRAPDLTHFSDPLKALWNGRASRRKMRNAGFDVLQDPAISNPFLA